MKARRPLGKGTYGVRGRSVRLWIEGDLIRAQWREHGVRKTKSWSNTAENRSYAKAWAGEFVAALDRPALPRRVTTRELWGQYAEAEFPTLRAKSQKVYGGCWRAWEVFVTPHSLAEDLGVLTMTQFRTDRERHGWAVGTIGQAVQVVKIVYAWAYRAKLITRNEVRDYRFKVAKEQRPATPDEFSRAEWDTLLAQLPLDRSTTWRARAVMELLGLQGVRQNAVLHLQKRDVDFEAREITWRGEWDKLGEEWVQPMRPRTAEVLRAVLAWHEKLHLDSPWFFPPGSRKSTREVYSQQSLWQALRLAEVNAKIEHRPRRAGHGARKMLFGDVLGITGSVQDAMHATNHKSLKVAERYNKRRLTGVKSAFDRLDKVANDNATTTAPAGSAEAVTEGEE